MFSVYTPARAFWIAVWLTSVANIWIATWSFFSSRYSSKAIRIEYTSSPVEQPGTQMRIGASGGLPCTMRGNTFSCNVAKVSGSRKNPVTLISMSSNRASTSLGFCVRYLT